MALGIAVGLAGLAGVQTRRAGTTALLTAVAPAQRNTITAWTVPAGCGKASAYASTSVVREQGTVVTAAKDSVVYVTATDTVVFANPHTCIVATVPGVDIVNLDGTVHLVLTVLTDVCQTADQLPRADATRCTWWQQHHPGLVTLLNGSAAPKLARAIPQTSATTAGLAPEPARTPAPAPTPSVTSTEATSTEATSIAPSTTSTTPPTSSTPPTTEEASP